MAQVLEAAIAYESPGGLLRPVGIFAAMTLLPALGLAWLLAFGATGLQGGWVLAPAALTPDAQRMNPANNLKQLVSFSGLARLLKSLVPGAAIVYLAVSIVRREWAAMERAVQHSPQSSIAQVASLLFEIGWKAGLTVLLWSGLDYLLQRAQFERHLRMSKEEVREENKETEGHPMIRMRIRRLQRQMRRRSMLKEVARATVVITNPTEFAVALRYDPVWMEAPTCVAKGRGLIAQEIRRLALWHQVPVVENPPLARALYRAVDVGRSIPAKLYTAVAEILAFIYRAQAQAQAASATGRPGA
jgi:flagellar biosynthetic protein FlhB